LGNFKKIASITAIRPSNCFFNWRFYSEECDPPGTLADDSTCSDSCQIELVSCLGLDGIVSYWKAEGDATDSVDENNGAILANTKLLMHFDEGSGTVANDETGYSNDGTLGDGTCIPGEGSCPAWTTGKVGGALSFDGNDDRVYNINLGASTEFKTLEMWLYQPSYQSTSYVGLFSDGYVGLRVNHGPGDANPNFYCKGNHISYNFNMPAGEWVHVALVFTGNNLEWYKNGVKVDTISFSGYPSSDNCRYSPADGIWSIAYNEGDGRYFNGLIDEVVIYNRTLTPEEIADHYNAQKAKFIEETDGQVGKSLSFDGIDDYMNTGSDSSIQLSGKSFSWAAWVKREATGHNFIFGYQTTIDGRRLHIGYRSNGPFTFAFSYDDLNTPESYDDLDEWHFWAGTFNATTLERKIYRDGILVAQDYAGGNNVGGGDLYIGFGNAGSDTYFNGLIDEVAIYNRGLTADEISQHYQNGLVGKGYCQP